MTIDLSLPSDTTSLMRLEKPNFYSQARIDLQHNQLKHRISTKDSDIVYYCSSREIYALHLKSQRRELVKSLTWVPTCLDAAHGWICAGGPDEGQCAFIHVSNDHTDVPWSRSRIRGAEVDDLLPLDLDPESRSLSQHQYTPSANSDIPTYKMFPYKLGTDIVNSVTVQKMHGTQAGTEDEILAITTNNDKRVTIFSLSQFKPLVILEYPTQMNHATISPDGLLLLAVGDEGQAFFHRRCTSDHLAVANGKNFTTHGWQLLVEARLPQTPPDDACFSTSFSPTGHLCAVASQGGFITIYDTSLISDDMDTDDAVVCVLKTSRPSTDHNRTGAVRSMSFSPSPWDMLVWAEDQGQVSILDLRRPGFSSKQTIELSTDPSDVLTVSFSDMQDVLEQRQLEIERRFLESHREALEAQDHLAAVSNTADYMEYAAQRRQRERDQLNSEVQALRQDSQRLTESERLMIDSIGLRRVQANADNPSTSHTAETSAHHTPALSSRHAADPLSSANLPTSSPVASAGQQSHSSASLAISEFPNMLANLARENETRRNTASIAEYVRQRNLERNRAHDRAHQPRRRSSVVISNSSSITAHNNNSSTLAPIGTATRTLSASPSRLPSSSNDAATANANETTPPSRAASSLAAPDPWLTITDAMAINANNANPNYHSRGNDALTEASDIVARARRQVDILGNGGRFVDLRPSAATTVRHYQPVAADSAPRTERQRNQTATRVQQFRHMHAVATGDGGLRSMFPQSRAGGVVVQGVGWSVDGRSLFVGTENGILEYAVNIRERMQWPGDTMV